MNIIFDFNRTIYDPDTSTLVPGVLDVLTTFIARGAVLHLVSRREPGREVLLDDLGITQFFRSTSFANEKEVAIRQIIEASEGVVYVVGDHLHDEIRIGNRQGARTVWFKRGKFAGLVPEGSVDIPWRTIERMEDLVEHIA